MGDNKRFPASQRKLRRAREQGDVAKSGEVTAAAVLTTVILTIFILPGLWQELAAMFLPWEELAKDFELSGVVLYCRQLALAFSKIAGSCLGVALISAVAVELLQVGACCSFRSLAPQGSRLNPVDGLKRMFGISGNGEHGFVQKLLYEIGKPTLLVIVGLVLTGAGVVCTFCWLGGGSPDEVGFLVFAISRLAWFLSTLALGLFWVIGVVDLLVARKRRGERLKMDVEEFRREMRENDGSPELKGLRRQRHQEIIFQSMVDGVRRARLVVAGRSKV